MVKEILEIQRNIERANKTDKRVQNIACHINANCLKGIHHSMKSNKASGIDGVSKRDYEEHLDENIENLFRRMRDGSYQPKPTRRVYIPKDSKGKMRPLGISSYEDKLVENAIAQILTLIYEQKFYDFSYGFRPNRNCHMAVKAIIQKTQCQNISYVVEADIRSFFDTVSHDWLIKMLEHDIADKRFVELVGKFLKAGIMENGKYLDSEVGTPQGNGASPVLANIFLHYILDNWFDVVVKRQCKGETFLIRYADDWLCCFENRIEAEVFLSRVKERLEKYGLSLAEEKTRILEFGRNACDKSATFDFLGFTFYGGTDRNKRFYRSKVRTCKKKFRAKLKAMDKWLGENRNLPLKVVFEKVNQKLVGHYRYYGVTDNIFELKAFKYRTTLLIFKWLNRRSQRKSYTWNKYVQGVLRSFPLAQPKIFVCVLPI